MPPRPLQSFLRPLPGLASQQQQQGRTGVQSLLAQRDPYNLQSVPIEGHLPTEDEIEAQRGEDNGSNFFFDLLALPSKIAGEFVKATLAGDWEQAALNNPVSGLVAGISDIFNLGLKQKIGFEEVPFANIREAWGEKGNVEEGFWNGVLNLAGEIVTDPTTFWFPFGKLGAVEKTGDNVIGMLGKGAKAPLSTTERARGLLGLPRMHPGQSSVIKVPGFEDVIERAGAIEKMERTALVFRLPMTDLGFFFRFEHLDNAIAKSVEKLGDFMNKNPLMAPIMKGFGSAPTGPLAGLVDTSSAPGRRWFRFLRGLAKEQKGAYTTHFQKYLATLANQYGDVTRNSEKARTMIFLREVGVDLLDDSATISYKMDSFGSTYKGKVRLKKWIEAGGDDAVSAKRLKEYKEAVKDPEKMKAWMDNHSNLPLPLRAISNVGLSPRHGIDIWDPRLAGEAMGVSEQVSASLGKKATGLRRMGGEEIKSPIIGEVSDVMTEDVITGKGIPDIQQQIRAEVAKSRKAHWESLNSGEQKQILGAVDTVKQMADDMRIWEQGEGLLNQTTLFYVPHELSDNARQVINSHVRNAITAEFGEKSGELYKRLVNSRKREFADWTVEEVNELYAKFGGKQTGYIPMKDLPDTAFLSTEARLFDRILPALKKLRRAEKIDKVSWSHMKEFFGTNALGHWDRRMQRAATLIERNTLIRRTLDADAPWIYDTTKMSKLAARQTEMMEQNLVPMVVVDRNSARVADMGEVMRSSMHFDAKAKVGLARGWLRDSANKQILVDNASYNDVVRHLDDSAKLTPGLHSPSPLDSPATSNLKYHLRKLKQGGKPGQVAHHRKQVDLYREAIAEEKKLLAADKSKYEQLVSRGAATNLGNIKRSPLRQADADREFAIWRQSRERGGAMALDELKETDPKMYEKLLKDDREVVLMHKETADNLFGDKGYIQSLYRVDPLSKNSLIHSYDKMTSLWKAWTVGLPVWNQTRIRDFVSNMRIGMWAGLTPKDMAFNTVEAGRLTNALKKYAKGDMDALKGVKIKGAEGVEATAEEWFDAAHRHGGVNSGFVTDVYSEELSGGMFQKNPYLKKKWQDDVWKVWDPNSAVFRWGMGYANWIDNTSKQLLATSFFKKGMSIDEAWRTASRYSYDYNKLLTPTERFGARRFIPFYNFLKYSTGMTVDAYFRNPGSVTFWDKLHKVANASVGVDDPAHFDEMMPRFIKDFLGVPFQKGKDGTVKYALFGGYFPEGNMAEMANAFQWFFDEKTREQDSLVNNVLSQMNPYIKIMVENIRNESAYTGSEIERYPGEQVEFLGMKVGPKWVNILRQVRLLQQIDKLGFMDSEDADNLVAAWRLRFEKEKGPLERFATSAFGPGIRTYNIDIEKNARRSWQKLNFAKSKAKGQMRRQLATGSDLGEQEAETLKEHIANLAGQQRDIEEMVEPFLE